MPNHPVHRLLTATFFALLAAASAPAETAPLIRMIDPSATDPAVSDATGQHLVARAPNDASGYLVVFFPGTGATPDDYSQLLEHAAGRGHHVIGLAYRNENSVNFVYCRGQMQTDCPEKARQEILTGENVSEQVEVDEPNSGYGRLRRLLAYLEENDPDERWALFLRAGEIAWERVIVAGQSQGGGHAAFTAKRHRVARAVLFSATEPAPWTSSPSLTPASAWFGIVHSQEVNAQGIKTSWSRLGLPGELTSIDGQQPPYGGAHQLETSRSDCGGDPESTGFYHNCTSGDDWLPPPGPDGRPALAELWDSLFVMHPGGVAGPIFIAGPMGRPDTSYIDPELLGEESLLVYQDGPGAIVLASVARRDGGFLQAAGRDWILDEGAWPVNETFNGPEFGIDRQGWAVFYTKKNDGVPALWRAGFDSAEIVSEPLTEGSRRQTVLASKDASAEQTRLLFLNGNLYSGLVSWQDEDDPDSETNLGFHDREVRWIDDRRSFVHIPARGDQAGELVLIDTVAGSRRLITGDGEPKSFPFGFVDPRDGQLKVLALVDDATRIAVWGDPGGDGLFEPLARWAPTVDTKDASLGSPEAFIANGRAWVSFIVRDGPLAGPAQVWLAQTDGSDAHRCDDGEPDLARSDPETLVTRHGVAVYYNVIEPHGYRLYRCVSHHPELRDQIFSSRFQAEAGLGATPAQGVEAAHQ